MWETPEETLCGLCKEFYSRGMTGTGGAMSLIQDDACYVTPSGVEKERLSPASIFRLDAATRDVKVGPADVKLSDCAPLFFLCHEQRKAGCCIHTHSIWANLVTTLSESNEFRISNQEMIKALRSTGLKRGGVRASYSNTDQVVIPITENAPTESELLPGMTKALADYPDAPCVLVRGHGVFTWGSNWVKAKCQLECLDYLFELAVRQRGLGI